MAVKCAGARTAAVLLLSALLAAGCTPESNPGDPTPSGTASSPTVSPSSSPTPTPTTSKPTPKPDPEDVAAVEAKAAYVSLWRAYDQMAQSGGADEPSTAMKEVLTGDALDVFAQITKRAKKDRLVQEGDSVVSTLQVGLVNLASKPQLVELSACVDRSKVKVTTGGKAAKGALKFITEQPELRYVDGHWKIAKISNQPAESC